MNHEKYKDPTAERAIAEADRWERWQQDLEKKHGIKRGDIIQIITTSYSSREGKIIRKKDKSQSKSLVSICGRTAAPERNNQITYILGTGTTESGRWYRWKRMCWNSTWS